VIGRGDRPDPVTVASTIASEPLSIASSLGAIHVVEPAVRAKMRLAS